MQGMQSKKEGHQRAAPEGSGHPFQGGEQKQSGQRVKQHISQVMPPAAQPEESVGRHMRNPCQRKPVGGVVGGERPNQAVPRQSGTHVVVFADVFRVVKVDKIKMPDLAVDCQGGEKQQQVDAQHARWIVLASPGVLLAFPPALGEPWLDVRLVSSRIHAAITAGRRNRSICGPRRPPRRSPFAGLIFAGVTGFPTGPVVIISRSPSRASEVLW